MADSETVDTTQQVTSQTPDKKPEKNPKRVAAGKAIAEKTRLAREAQKKALDEAKAIIEETTTPAEAQEKKAPEADPEAILTTTQWPSVISMFLSMVGIYYKRKEIKAIFAPPVEPKKEGKPPVETRAVGCAA